MKHINPNVVIAVIIIAIVAVLAAARAWIFDLEFWTAVLQVTATASFIVAFFSVMDTRKDWPKGVVVFAVYCAVWYLPILYLAAAVLGMALTIAAIMVFVKDDQPA